MRRYRLLLALALALAAPILLEANARYQTDCSQGRFEPSDPCAELPVPTTPEAIQERIALLQALHDKRQAGEETLAEAEAAARALVVWESDPGWPYNGVACSGVYVIKVRDDLPALAERYVLLHELEHLLSPERTETEVNFIAARRAPVGMALTVVSSVAKTLGGEGSLGCKLASLWLVFCRYFLDRY